MSICTLGNVKTRVAIEEGKCWRRSETSIESQLFVQGLNGICFLKNNSDIKERTKKKILINYTKSCTQARRRKNGPGGTQCGVGGGPECPGSAQQRRRRRRRHARNAVRGGGRAAGAGSAHNSYGRRECARRLGSIPKKRLRARGGCGAARAGTQCAPGGAVRTGSATGAGRAARRMGGIQRKVLGPWDTPGAGAAEQNRWASPGSERRGGTANRRTAVLGAGSTCIPHGVGRCLGTRAARWATE
ncbi:hypothetical protein B0H14DRAFT_2584162 [Mycena olivaceomarginata]|nr:hypothetical protein B0H14DRAFT_2584162 [Mycena olivaceomarginata]